MNVGEYVRTKDGKIFKENGDDIKLNANKNLLIQVTSKLPYSCIQWYVKNHSSQIIDLIEVGDYVNGYLVKDIDYAFDDIVMNNKNARIVPYIDCNKNNYIDDIKTIVTHEQMEAMQYRVEE